MILCQTNCYYTVWSPIRDYELKVVESHQAGKADTSGTAKAVVASLADLGIRGCDEDRIQMLREPEQQRAFGVPEAHIPGHAFHTYTISSPDGTSVLEFKHNICGRGVYAQGSVDAVEFLVGRMQVHASASWHLIIFSFSSTICPRFVSLHLLQSKCRHGHIQPYDCTLTPIYFYRRVYLCIHKSTHTRSHKYTHISLSYSNRYSSSIAM